MLRLGSADTDSDAKRPPIRARSLDDAVHRDGPDVADSAVRSRLRRVKDCAAMASPCHVPAVAGAPDRANRPTTVAVLVAVRAACRRDHHPAALGGHEITDIVVREVVATRYGHHAVVARTPDRPLAAVTTVPPGRQRCWPSSGKARHARRDDGPTRGPVTYATGHRGRSTLSSLSPLGARDSGPGTGGSKTAASPPVPVSQIVERTQNGKSNAKTGKSNAKTGSQLL